MQLFQAPSPSIPSRHYPLGLGLATAWRFTLI
ncbi:hypothetical protein MTBLM1_100024 [Rhodospirillaceae bacterium LM-1]|nr:hypothetical protein MTBLM1_100024 [Rhodospirillaceae bacterium LM-1]